MLCCQESRLPQHCNWESHKCIATGKVTSADQKYYAVHRLERLSTTFKFCDQGLRH